MRRKKILALALAVTMTSSMSMTALAGSWEQDVMGWWYLEDDGSFARDGWKEIDGKQYYFDSQGHMLQDTITPDGYRVGSDGAWINDTTNTSVPKMKGGKYKEVSCINNSTGQQEELYNDFEQYYMIKEITETEARICIYTMYGSGLDESELLFTKNSDGVYRQDINKNESDDSKSTYNTVTFDSDSQMSIQSHIYIAYGDLTLDSTSVYQLQ